MHIGYKISIGIATAAVIGAAVFALKEKNNTGENSREQKAAAELFAAPGQKNTQNPSNSGQSQNLPAGKISYTNPQYNFHFNYDSSFKVGAFEEGEGNVVLLQKSGSQGQSSQGIQISITPFDEEINLTEARIKQDIPDLKMENVKTITVDNTPAVAFINPEGALGKTREVWLVKDLALYQIITQPEMETTLAELLLSWKW